MHKYVWLSLVVAACSSQADPIDGELLEIDVTADQPLDQITLILGDQGQTGDSGPLTPALIAAGQAAETPVTVFRSRPQLVTFDTPTQTEHFELAEPIEFEGPLELLALGYRRDAGNNLVLVSAGTLPDVQAEPSASKTYALSISAALVPSIETWGANAKLCARVAGAAYFVDPLDADCDGFPSGVDCNDEAFCDPTDPSAAAQAACTATSCEPCLDTTTGCALGSHVVCHGGGTVTCDAGGGCGPEVCLPGDSCQINCAQPWPMTDPTPCLEAAWRTAAEAAGAQHCQLPTTHSQFGSQTCPTGSTISVALPFTGCTNAQVAIGSDPINFTFTATVTAPCTLAVTLDATSLVLGVMEVLATVDTSTTTASVRLSLDPTDGACTGDGACDVAPTTSSCQL